LAHLEAHRLGVWMCDPADRRPLALQQVQEPHCLEEIELEGALEQNFF
jgi:hypothetical protein